MSWDDLGRLVMVTRRDTSNNGFNWVAGYDPLGRRLSANTQPVVAGVNSGSAVSTSSFYDPEAEFEEVYNSAGTQNRWLVHGPDLNEAYGGLNGTGGVEAVVNVSGATTTGIMSDAFGNTVATGTGTITNWNAVRSLGYGPQPGTTAQILDATHDVASALAWRGRYIDPTGFYNLGARTYDPASGTFLSCDPLGHAASMDLYSYCNGDPINGFDADGRIEAQFAKAADFADPYSGHYLGLSPDQQGAIQQQFTQRQYRSEQESLYAGAWGNALSHQSTIAQAEVLTFTMASQVPGATNGYRSFTDLRQGNYTGAAGHAVFWFGEIGAGALTGKVGGSLGEGPQILKPGNAPQTLADDDVPLENWENEGGALRTGPQAVDVAAPVADRIKQVAQQGYDYAVQNPRVNGLNRMQLGKDAEVQATRWLRRWAKHSDVDLGLGGLRFQVSGASSVPDVVYDPAAQIYDFKLTPKAVRSAQTQNFQNDFPGYNINYIFGP